MLKLWKNKCLSTPSKIKKVVNLKEKLNTSGYDAITKEFERIYPNQKKPKCYTTIISWEMGGDNPLNAVRVYESKDAWHFVTYGLSELYEKFTDDKSKSGFGMEFTLRLKKVEYRDLEAEMKCIVGILKTLALETFEKGEIFSPYEFVYTGQEFGFDVEGISDLTGFITIPDMLVHPIDTPNGRVEFVEFVGVTNAELESLLNKKSTVKKIYKKLGSDITDYDRKSLL